MEKRPTRALSGREAAALKRTQEKQKRDSRRAFLVASGGGLSLLGLLGLNFATLPSKKAEGNHPYEGRKAERGPHQTSERFLRSRETYQTLFGTLSGNQVIFVDQYGAMIGEPREPVFERNAQNQMQIAQAWLNLERTKICADESVYCNLNQDIPRQLNVIRQLRGQPAGTTYVDIVAKHGTEKMKPPFEKLTKIQYVAAHLKDTLSISSPAAIAELCKRAPALPGIESGYQDNLTSAVGAEHSVQAMPSSREALGYSEADFLHFEKQVAYMGAQFTEHYKEIERLLGPETLLRIKTEYFGGDEDAFQRGFMAFMTLNSYIAGQGRMLEVFTWFTNKYPTREAFESIHGHYEGAVGKDFTHIMALETYFEGQVSGYGLDSSIYPIEIEALSEEMMARGLYT